MSAAETPGAVRGTPRLLLRLEGAALALAAILGYRATGEGWGLFALLILAPDLSMLGYLAGPAPGAMLYNAAHTTLAPAAIGALGLALGSALPVALALIWLAHIGIDRTFGYGLKYRAGFGFTHLGVIGKPHDDGAGKPVPD
ncbi:DUF4260 domain-containing protein [Ancylobacter sp. A5.8]|uniref:DUF4260 domain-containing protein n=1 Tax=Ancylobacter gelatini TaxID=2919920 RepID=UPI001F4EC338|nr:DUF4260 domain-containing protein [Ancylobacter gelatini]MCJ8144711.1 DUF4260 domain-containing protein [Ancylobacter gelatini]